MNTSRIIKFEGIGTHWQIDIMQSLPAKTMSRLETALLATVEEYDQTYSRFRPDSLVQSISKHGGEITLPSSGKALFDFYEKLYWVTGGKVTPLIGSVLEAAGYDAAYSLRPKSHIAPAPRWEDSLNYAFPLLELSAPATIDVGAAGKGHLIDILGELLQTSGVHNFVIDGSGDILHCSVQPDSSLRVGMEHPHNPSQIIGAVTINNQSICCSATNRRKWAQYNHIMDPHTAEPVKEIVSVWTLAATALEADGLATALFFCQGDVLQKQFQFEYFVVHDDLSYTHSSGWPTADVY